MQGHFAIDDAFFPIAQADALDAKLTAANVPHEFHRYKGAARVRERDGAEPADCGAIRRERRRHRVAARDGVLRETPGPYRGIRLGQLRTRSMLSGLSRLSPAITMNR